MATILEMLQGELDAAATEGKQPASWELSAEALAALKTIDDEAVVPAGGKTAFGLPIVESDVPGLAILLVTDPT